jgi:DNA repair protein RecN (Recombination protein N)
MLNTLRLHNVAVLREAAVEFSPSLTVITGETGAGKSVLLGSLRLIGAHADELYVEAEFSGQVPVALRDLTDDGGDQFILARRVKTNGSRALVDGRGCSAQVLADASEDLFTLTGQHAARRLVSASFQRELLDRYGASRDQASTVSSLYKQWRETVKEREAMSKQIAETRLREELLRHEVKMLDELGPRPGEDKQLHAELGKLANATELIQSAETAAGLISDDDQCATSMLIAAVGELQNAARHDESFEVFVETLQSALDQISETARDLRSVSESLDTDPERLEFVHHRLQSINDLQRRYGTDDLQEILERVAKQADDLQELDNAERILADLEAKVSSLHEEFIAAASALSDLRRAGAEKLTAAVDVELHSLGLEGAHFAVILVQVDPGPNGAEEIRFELAANKGLASVPLDKGASGGELSRVNLALLLAVSNKGGVFVFDEVDAGIGGETAHILGKKLKQLAETSQVIVITHLAQIALHADRHYKVEKDMTDALTTTVVRELVSSEDRDKEIARIMGATDAQATEASTLVRAAAAA